MKVSDESPPAQRRGGAGKLGGKLREDDTLSLVLPAMSHDHLLFIATDGSCFSLRAFNVPERSRAAQGSPVGELLPHLKPNVGISTIVPIREHSEDRSLVLLSKLGKIKRMPLVSLLCAPRPPVPCFFKCAALSRRASGSVLPQGLLFGRRCPPGSTGT
jgi:DNA gyrase/topoisomerase IV subunit A